VPRDYKVDLMMNSRMRVPYLLTAVLLGCTSSTGASGGTVAAATGDVADATATDSAADTTNAADSATDAGSGSDAADAIPQDTGVPAEATTKLTGTLGKLGKVLPTVSSLMISNSGETLIYMSSGPLTCDMLTVSHWLKSAEAGSQVVEIVLPGNPKVGKLAVPPAEINYAAGGKSSSYEVNADSGTITFTEVAIKDHVAGTLTAKYPSGSVSGSFSATFCNAGQGF
jgi:hypothetical protein